MSLPAETYRPDDDPTLGLTSDWRSRRGHEKFQNLSIFKGTNGRIKKKQAWRGWKLQKPKGEPFLDPTGGRTFHPTVAGRLRVKKGVLNVPIMCEWKRNRGDSSNFTPRRQDGVGNFSPCARSLEHTSYNCSEENIIKAENGITYRPFETVPRKETINEKDYVNMDERFYTRGNEESMKPSLLQKSSMVNELLQARIETDESVEMHVEGEMSKEDFGDSMGDLSFEEDESEKYEKDESSKEEKNDLEDRERRKEMSEEKQENSKQELDVIEKNEEINFFANQTNSSLVREFPFVQNFGEPSKNQEERLIYNSIKTITFFPSNSYLCFEISFKEIKLFSLVYVEHGDHFIFLNSLGMYLERGYFIEFNSLSCATPRVDENDSNVANCVSCLLGVEGNLFLLVSSMTNCLSSHLFLEDPLMISSVMFDPSCYGFGNLDYTSLVELHIVGFALGFDKNYLQHIYTITSMRGRRHTMEFEGQGKSVGRKLILCYGDLTMSFSSNLFLFYLVFSFKELKLLLELNAFYVILVGNCMVNLFTCELVLDHMFKYSSLCAFLEKQLMKNFDVYISSIKLLCLMSYKFGFPHEEQKVLIVEEFLKTLLFGNIHGFQFYLFHFKEFMRLLNIRKKMNGSLKVFKAHPYDLVTFENGVFKLNLKNLVEKHLVYSIASVDFLFKGETLNESILQNTKSCVKIENQSLGATLLYSLIFKEFLDKLIFKRELEVLQVLMLNQEFSLLNNILKLFWNNLH
ncbi:hypothetical protein M9H77_02287 [Catharanthus roseus]|uniref:Uncharacterized protein n=1 Tax=Catharanthus roseus TaxID=4058 RepID=A0ACC0C835_CATRO|nr:hypothetical protein M9H77_02287 [Catharanthus roseus]